MAKIPFALQLYSVRDALHRDPAATLARIREIGYTHVELAGTEGMPIASFRPLLDEYGLTPVALHVPFDICRRGLDDVVHECEVLGVSRAVVPWLSGQENTTAGDWAERARELEEFGRAFSNAGIALCYHNHAHEFAPAGDGDRTMFDVIFETADPEFLGIELDVGWAQYAGADPVALIKTYAGRIPLLHIKDVKAPVPGEPPAITELGNGATRFGPVFRAAADAGVSWLIVEQDESARDPLESARMNAAYMRVHVP